MTEPTYHYRPDVIAQLEYLLERTHDQGSRMLEDEARESLRSALANAWTAGWVAASLPRHDDAPVVICPYDEMDKA
jgi:hypothetical protein